MDILTPFFKGYEWILPRTVVLLRAPASYACVWSIASAMIKVGANPAPFLIELHPQYYTPRTASGEGLRAHEMFHVWQRVVVPNFDVLYSEEADRVAALGLPQWVNGFETSAYRFERVVRARLIAEGLPASFGGEDA